MIPVGTVPTTSMIARRWSGSSIRPRAAARTNPVMIRAQSRRYRKSRAAAVPRCRIASTGTNAGLVSRKFSPIRGGTTTAWPSDDTGKSSVTPWSAARKKISPALSIGQSLPAPRA